MKRSSPHPLIALAGAAVLALGLAAPATAAHESSTETTATATSRTTAAATDEPVLEAAAHRRGHEGVCTDYKGVSVVIDFQELGGDSVRRCALPRGGETSFEGTGLDALAAAGIDLSGVQRWGMSFICRIEGRPSATERLTVSGQPYTEACQDTPPAAAYWSYWHTPTKSGPWTYSQMGVANRQATNGGYEGWSFSLNKSASTNPEPRVTPAAAPSDAPRPFSAATPSISGTPEVGRTLTVAAGNWTPAASTHAYQWYRDGVAISGATSPSYRLTAADDGATLTAKVTGTGADRAETWSTSKAISVSGASTPDPGPGPGGGTGAETAADWMHGELGDDGLMPGFSPGYPDVGLSIDAFWAMMAADPGDPRLARMWTDISAKAMDYAGTEWVNIGGSAKVLLAAETAGAGHEVPTSGGEKVDLRARVLESVDGDGELTGRQNTFVQSLAVMALVRSGAAESDKATVQRTVDALARRQCSDGWFVMTEIAADTTCDEEVAGGGWGQDNDATSVALMAYSSAEDAGLDVPDGAVGRALDSLEETQDGEGGIGGGGPTAASNSNSTGLAAAVLDDAGRTEAATSARDWVEAIQAGEDASGTMLATETGAIAYSPAAYETGKQEGLGIGRDQWRRATAQAALAFAPVLYGDLGLEEEEPGFTDSPQPTVMGKAKVGATLIAYQGAWSPKPATTSFRWMRDGEPIAYYGNRYTLSSRDVGHRISVRITAKSPDGVVVQRISEASDLVTGGTFTAPKPIVKGKGQVGATLIAYRGTWSPDPSTTSFRWMRDGKPIAYYGNRYRLSAYDRGHDVSVRVTGSRSGYPTKQVESTRIGVR